MIVGIGHARNEIDSKSMIKRGIMRGPFYGNHYYASVPFEMSLAEDTFLEIKLDSLNQGLRNIKLNQPLSA